MSTWGERDLPLSVGHRPLLHMCHTEGTRRLLREPTVTHYFQVWLDTSRLIVHSLALCFPTEALWEDLKGIDGSLGDRDLKDSMFCH